MERGSGPIWGECHLTVLNVEWLQSVADFHLRHAAGNFRPEGEVHSHNEQSLCLPYANWLMKQIPSVNAVVDRPRFVTSPSSVDSRNK